MNWGAVFEARWQRWLGWSCILSGLVRYDLVCAGVNEYNRLDLPCTDDGCTIKCVLNADAHTFAYSVDGGAPAVAFRGLPAGRPLYPAVFVVKHDWFRMLAHYDVQHVGFVVRTRVLCQGARARAGARGDVLSWLCERAPLWVVAHVCVLLRDDS